MLLETKQSFINRSRMDIIVSILTNSIEGSRKTRLLYRCNLSANQCNKYIDRLIEENLLGKSIQTVRGMKSYEVYQATEKGREFLRDYNRLGETGLKNIQKVDNKYRQ